MATKQFGIKLTVEIGDWALTAAPRYGFANRSVMIDELLKALRDGRLTMTPAPQAFPAEVEAPLGASPHNPLLIAHGDSK